MTLRMNTRAITPNGTFSQNAHRQSPTCTSSAPTEGPMAAATAPLADHAPTPVPRRDNRKGVDHDGRPHGKAQRRSDSLEGPSDDEHSGAGGQRRPRRCQGEHRDAGHQSPPPPPPLAQHPADHQVAAPTMVKELMTHDSSASLASGNDSFRSA